MTKKQFMEQVAEYVQKQCDFSDLEVSCDVFTKNNDTIRHGIVIKRKEESISPTIYIDGYYQDYLEKKLTIPETAEEVLKVLARVRNHAGQYNSFAVDFVSCQPRIVYRLISGRMNQRMLQGIPYIPFLDLAITFCVVCDCSGQGVELLRINNELMDKWEVTTADLLRLAEENTPRLFPLEIHSLANMLIHYFGLKNKFFCDGDSEDAMPLMLLTNNVGTNGASVLLYPDVIHNLAVKYDTDLYVLPSSVHEILVAPKDITESITKLSAMVKDINRKHVSPEEVLSDRAYYYDRKEKKFLL